MSLFLVCQNRDLSVCIKDVVCCVPGLGLVSVDCDLVVVSSLHQALQSSRLLYVSLH